MSTATNIDNHDDITSTRACSILMSWNVKMAPLTMRRNKLGLGNHLLVAIQRHSATKITIEIEKLTTAESSPTKESSTATFNPVRLKKIMLLLNESETTELGTDDEAALLNDDERVILKVWQRGEDNDDKKGWIEQAVYRMEEVRIDKVQHDAQAKIQFGVGRELLSRQAKFEDHEQAVRFQSILEKVSNMEQDRGKRQLEKYRAMNRKDDTDTSLLEDSDRIKLLVEVVSVTGIPKKVVPYVAIKMGGKVLHRTDYASSDTGSVIYTLFEGCFYLLNMTLLEFFCCTGGMTLLVKAQDSIARKGRIVGRAIVPLERLLSSNGQRDSYNLVGGAVGGEKGAAENESKICIRVRRATIDDIEFMTSFRMASTKVGVFAEETVLPLRAPTSAVGSLKIQHKVKHGEILHRVKPFPDPARPDESRWMTMDQINEESMKPTTHWVEAGSGNLGRVYIEILQCNDLPNMDFPSIPGRMTTDPFACLVFEDSIVTTDVISNETSPRWMPWCRRGFVFNVDHPSSNVMLGLFDFDPERSPVQVAMSIASDVHDPIARIMVNVANTIPDTVYTVTYPLYFAKSVKHRQESRGTITLRVRKDIYDKRKALLVGMAPPPQSYISVARNNDFSIAHYTTEGDLNEEAYSLNMLTSYIDELESYQVIGDYIYAAVVSILLWYAHYEVTVWNKTIMVPMNSALAFGWGIALTNNFNLFPSFLMFSITWFMLSCNDVASRPPSPWHKVRRYPPLLKSLFLGTSVPDSIAVNQGADAMEAYKQELAEKAEAIRVRKEEEAKYAQTLSEELDLNVGTDDGDEGIVSSKQRLLDRFKVNPVLLPFKSTLYPIQKELRKRVLQLRIATSIITWQERIYAFWITTLSAAAAFLFLWVPWAIILKWLLRITVWIVLGPWTALLARYKYPIKKDMTDEERREDMRKRSQARRREAIEASTRIQVRKESVLKTKALARWMFGSYHLRVPRFTEELFPDIPLPSSYAEPFDSDTSLHVEIKERVYGQSLYGEMIPKREVHVDRRIIDKAQDDVFVKAGLLKYFEDSYGWAQFLGVSRASYGVAGYGLAKGRVYAKTGDERNARLVGISTMQMASTGWSVGAQLSSQIIFFEDERAFERFSSGRFEIVAGAGVTVKTICAEQSTGTTAGIPVLNRFATSKGKKCDKSTTYHNGMATFVIMQTGVLVDLSVVGQKFSYDAL